MPYKGMDDNIRRLEMKVDRLEKEGKSKKDDQRFLHINLAGFAFLTFVLGVLGWQMFGSSHPITIGALIVASLALIGLNIYHMFRSPGALKKPKEKKE